MRGFARAPQSPTKDLFVFNGGFLTDKRVRRILELAGHKPRLGLPKAGDHVGVWGHSPTSHRGETIAACRGAEVLRVEDPFLRSLKPGRMGDRTRGLLIDARGAHYDSSVPSDLETLLAEDPLDDTALLDQARAALALIRRAHLSKYNLTDPAVAPPEPGYVLVIDQTKGDASIRRGGANADRFAEMLLDARLENPEARIVIKTHPETAQKLRLGHFDPATTHGDVAFETRPVSPWDLLEGAVKVYTVSSQLGFEAILAGHKPIVFGQPFYAGWGLSEDRFPVDRRQRNLSRAQLFAAAQLLYPYWYAPETDRLTSIDEVICSLEALTRAWREDRAGWKASEIRLWKRPVFRSFFGRHGKLTFGPTSQSSADRTMIWASKAPPPSEDDAPLTRVEDGFLRSKGLGAELVPPLSLVLDDQGIYYDPSRPSKLEALIQASPRLPEPCVARAERLTRSLIKSRVTKYNLTGLLPDLRDGHRILVPGQVEDDDSVTLGGGGIQTNRTLLERVRYENPEAVIIFKTHPDVVAGLRPGALDASAQALADQIIDAGDPISLIHAADEVWTLTSLMGFEALLRGTPVTTLGHPFYAGWGLTRDLAPKLERRSAKVSLHELVHATLIDYPRYYDPVLRQAASPETVIARLSSDRALAGGPALRVLAKAQGVFASFAPFWR